MRQIARAAAGSLLLTAFLITPAAAQNYPPDQRTIAVSDSTVSPCDSVTVTGDKFPPGTIVEITFAGAVIGTATVGSDSTFSASVQIPCATAPGTYVLAAGGATTEITVLAAGGGGGSAGTGANLGAGIVILAVLFVLGVAALVITRRRAGTDRAQHVESRSS